MNHADRVIAEAKQAVQDYEVFMRRNPEVPEYVRLLQEVAAFVRKTSHITIYRQVIAPEVIDVVNEYNRLFSAAEHSRHTLAIYGVEA